MVTNNPKVDNSGHEKEKPRELDWDKLESSRPDDHGYRRGPYGPYPSQRNADK